MTIVEIERLANGGDGVGHLPDGRVIFVPRAVPGDRVEITIERQKKSWARARITRVVEGAPARGESRCGHFHECGGCAFQHVDYSAEFSWKVQAAIDAFCRIAGLEAPPGERIEASTPTGYRIRARLHADSGTLGYKRAGTHDVFDLLDCPVLDPSLNASVVPLRHAIGACEGEVEIETAGGGEIVVVLRGDFDRVVAERVATLDGVRGVRLEPSGFTVAAPLVDGEEIWDVATPEQMRLPAGRFRQSNGPMTSVLRELVAQRVGEGEQLVELFAGSGSLTFAVAAGFDAVTALELDPDAVVAGNGIARALGLEHVTFEEADLEKEVRELSGHQTVLLDPPRTGARAVAEALAASDVAHVVYVSCDVGTLARDTKILVSGGLELATLDFVDMFPRTPHVEAIAVFRRSTSS